MIIPKRVREALGLKRGTELAVELLPGEGFVARARSSVRDARIRELAGVLSHRGGRMTAAAQKAAVTAALLAEDERSKRKAGSRG